MTSRKFVAFASLVLVSLFLLGCTEQMKQFIKDTSLNLSATSQGGPTSTGVPKSFHPLKPSSASADSSQVPSFPSGANSAAGANSSSSSQSGYNGGVPFGNYTVPQPPPSPVEPDPSGTYRIYSSYIADHGVVSMPFADNLVLSPSGDWTFGSSSGSWSVSKITDSDWQTWGVSSYGPNYKIIMDNWNGAGASGPIETEADGTVDFVWVIYNTPQGTEQLKFGH